MHPILNQIDDLWADADNDGRREIRRHVNGLKIDHFKGWDAMPRLAGGPLKMALAKIGVDLNIFRILTESDKPVSLAELGIKTGASVDLLVRILRSMAASGQIKETAVHEYAANDFSYLLADENDAGGLCHQFDILSPCVINMPKYLAETNYQNVTSKYHTVFQKAFDTKQSIFEWMVQYPEHMKNLGRLMAIQRPFNWVNSYPVKERLGLSESSTAADGAILVDVGGGFGQQAIAFRNKFPDMPGRVVVQDLPQTLAGATPAAGVEFMEHDFLGPQPVRNANVYYLRHVLHDWPEADCVRILKNIIPAMGPESRVIIDEIVTPDIHVPWRVAYMDLLMMVSCGGIERTRAEWERLFEKAGLKIVDVHEYNHEIGQCVMVTVRQ